MYFPNSNALTAIPLTLFPGFMALYSVYMSENIFSFSNTQLNHINIINSEKKVMIRVTIKG